MSRVAALSFHLGLARQVQGEAKPDIVDVGSAIFHHVMDSLPLYQTYVLGWAKDLSYGRVSLGGRGGRYHLMLERSMLSQVRSKNQCLTLVCWL